MAPQKRKAGDYDKSDPFVVDDDETSPAPPTKRTKGTTNNTAGSIPEMKRDEEDNQYWEISKARRVTVSDFKGKRMVSIREYYEKDGKWLPGKKGITMTIEQYSNFLTIIPQIETQLAGEQLPRPKFDGGPVRSNRLGEGDGDDDDEQEKKANIEATSDEDED